jgi:antitoxin component HigA of HigAB toxin-antitoxin module
MASTKSSDVYLDLVHTFPLRPIRTRAMYEQGRRMLRSLVGKRSSAVRDYKVVLGSLVADYERNASLQIDTSKITASEIVRHLLDERHKSVNALARELRISQSSLSDMLNGRRDWSKSAIVRIADYFGLQPALFLRN